MQFLQLEAMAGPLPCQKASTGCSQIDGNKRCDLRDTILCYLQACLYLGKPILFFIGNHRRLASFIESLVLPSKMAARRNTLSFVSKIKPLQPSHAGAAGNIR